MSKNFYNLDKYKTDISLPDFLKNQLGWTLAVGSTNKQPKLKSPDGELLLIIKINHKGHYTCWNAYESDPFLNDRPNTGEKKIYPGATIIDIIQWQHNRITGNNLTIPEVAKILDEYISRGETISKDASEYTYEKEHLSGEKVFTAVRTNTVPLEDTRFLQSRGIDPRMLKHSKIWQDVFRNVKFYNPATRQTFINTATRLVSPSGIVGMSIRMANGQKRIEGSRLESLSSTKVVQCPINRLHIFESMIDAASYYQMNYYLEGLNPSDNDNIQLVSTEGAVTAPQINTIQQIIQRNKVKNVEINFDRDIHGLVYAANVVGNISISEKEENKHIEYIRTSKSEQNEDMKICMDVKLKTDNLNSATEITQKLFPEDILNQYTDTNNWNINLISTEKDNCIFRLTMPCEEKLLNDIVNNISEYRFGKAVGLRLPQNKDFNDDLNLPKIEKTNNILVKNNNNEISLL